MSKKALRLKRLLKLRNKAGFTLVEVIIACALLGVLVIGIMAFITPVLKMVRSKESNARALMLSEAIDNYIATTTQYAYYVQTISNAAKSDTTGVTPSVMSLKYTGTEFPKKANKGLSTLKTCYDNMTNKDKYEVRCIGMRWLEDPLSGEKKLMLTNEFVDQNSMALDASKSVPVFETCFYDGLYPIVKFENYNNQYQINGADQVEADKVDIAPGLKITVDVYTDMDCYRVTENVRKSATLSYVGTTYTEFNVIKNYLLNKGDFEVIPNIEANTYDGASAKDLAVQYKEDGNSYYYPESFIYYIARKPKT